MTDDVPEPENLSTKPEDLSRRAEKRRATCSPSRSPSFLDTPQPISSPIHTTPIQPVATHLLYPTKPITPPVGITPIHPIVKKERLEVIQHDGGSVHYLGSKPPININTPVEPIAHYATPAWARTPPMYPPHYFPYATNYRFPGAELYPSYPVPAYQGSPDHTSVSPPPPHVALTCPTIQRPIPRSYWPPSTSPDHCTLSPTSSMSYGSLRSPPPVTPEDLSSPGSDSGRSSAGSTSAGPTILIKMDSMTTSSSSTTSSTTTASRYQCPDCGKSYSTYSGLSKHQQFHCAAAEGQTKKSFSCKYCEKVYVSLGALKMHIRTHTLPCKCHLCGKAFSRPWLLQGHIRTHTGEKPFSCQHCNRAFADRSNLRAHLQTHSDVKKYSCSSCSKTFSRMSLLTKHQEGGCPGMAVPMGYGC